MLINRRRSRSTTTTTLARVNGPATHYLPGARKRARAHELMSLRASAGATRKATTTYYQPSTPPPLQYAQVYLQRYHRPNKVPETTATAAGVAIGTAQMLRLAPLPTPPASAPLLPCEREEKGKRKAEAQISCHLQEQSSAKRRCFRFCFPPPPLSRCAPHHQPPLPPPPPPRRPASEINGPVHARTASNDARAAAAG
jgi:hypothetical protein